MLCLSKSIACSGLILVSVEERGSLPPLFVCARSMKFFLLTVEQRTNHQPPDSLPEFFKWDQIVLK